MRSYFVEREICQRRICKGFVFRVGKTTTCLILKNKLPNCVFPDEDWCWDMHPFQVTPETKKMVMENICFLLNQFIRCIPYENIIFCWMMHEQAIMDEILLKLETGNCLVHTISLICDADGLRKRLQKDVDADIRPAELPSGKQSAFWQSMPIFCF